MDNTELKVTRQVEASSTWQFMIENFSKYNLIDQRLTSPYVGVNEEDKWCLMCFPHGEKINKGEYVSFYILHKSIDKLIGDELKGKFSIITTDPNIKYEQKSSYVVLDNNKIFGYGLSFCVKISELIEKKDIYLPNDNLTIQCDISKSLGNIFKKKLINVPTSSFNINQSLLRDIKLGDAVTLQAKDKKEFKVYKGILTSQSTVFAGILGSKDPPLKKIKLEHGQEHQQQTNNYIPNNLIVFVDMTGQVCERMIEFFYTDKLPLCDDEIIKELLGAAEKYKLIKLKALCEEAIYGNLTIENSSNVLITADLYKAHQLKEATIQLITQNIDNVIKTDGYISLKRTNPGLTFEIFEKIHRK